MRLFKSKYRTRIEAKIVELEKEIEVIKSKQYEIRLSLNAPLYCHYSVEIGNLEKQIKLLKNLL